MATISEKSLLKRIFDKLSSEERNYLGELINRDPLRPLYGKTFVVYLTLLIIALLWPFDQLFPVKNGVSWLTRSNGIEFSKNGQVYSAVETNELYRLLQEGNGLSIEMVVATGDINQTGPARIFSYSKGSGKRNFTLAQKEKSLVVRLRTNNTDPNGVFPHLELKMCSARRMCDTLCLHTTTLNKMSL